MGSESKQNRTSKPNGPSTNNESVPDGLEGSIMNDDQDGSDRGDDRGKGATSKSKGDREEGSDRSVHDL